MKGLVLFRSHYGNTKQVADSIARQITALGHEAIVQDVRQKLPDLQDLDFVMIGSPIPKNSYRELLKSLSNKYG